jgi:DNA ligase (NAD+)
MTNLEQKKTKYIKASHAYYNKQPIMTDADFDKLEAQIRKEDPNWPILSKTGVKVVNKKTEVKLEHFMPSLNKAYGESINKWMAKQKSPILVMNKLDGSSVQLTYNNGVPVKLVTRGDGINGGDISFLLPYFNLPKRISSKSRTVFRCEAVIDRKVFAKKYAGEFDNPRNTVNGWLNRKTPHPGLKDVHIVVLGMYGMPLVMGVEVARCYGFEVVEYAHMLLGKKDPSIMLSNRLLAQRNVAKYDMDGLVLCPDSQNFMYENSDKPKWAIAFKENVSDAKAIEATVEEIIWQDSAKSRLIPKIKIKPVRVGGVTITYIAAHNAQLMIDNGIGKGAVIKIIRSGDVIPTLVGVVKKAKPNYPSVEYKQEGVHFVAVERSAEADIRALGKFFKTLGIEFIASKTIATLYATGNFTTPLEYLHAWSTTDFSANLHAHGIGLAMSKKIANEFDRVFSINSGVLLRDLMAASNCFDAGIGARIFKSIQKATSPDIFMRILRKDLVGVLKITKMIREVSGIGGARVNLFMKGMRTFREWFAHVHKYIPIRNEKEPAKFAKQDKLRGLRVSFTRYRDKSQEEYIVNNGGEVVSFGGRTQILFYKESGKKSGKVSIAQEKGIKTLTFEQWRDYNEIN